MKKELNSNKLYKKLLIFGILLYVMYIFVGQQKTLNSYKNTEKYYSEQLGKQLAHQQTLNDTKSNINSKEYIEKVAREKLDMYLPNERVYIDKCN